MSISPGTMTVGILAIVAGLVGAYAVRTALLDEPVAEAAAPVAIVIPLAAIDLPAGRTLSLGDIGLVEMTDDEIGHRDLPMTLVMIDPEQIIGRTLEQPIKRGEPFLTTSMYLEGTRPDVSKKLKPGFRAFTIEIPRVLIGGIASGSMVDVIFRTDARESEGDTLAIPEATMALIQDIEVLEVEQPRATGRTGALNIASINNAASQQRHPVITLAVTLDQVNILRTVEGRGELSLVARAASEVATATENTKTITLESLLGLQAKPNRNFVTQIYRRGALETNTFRGDFRESRPAVPTSDRSVTAPVSTGGVTYAADNRVDSEN